jgi:hypothetical protein
MKKFIAIFAALAILASACSEREPVSTIKGQKGKVTISVTNETVASRADLFAETVVPEVDNVMVYIYKQDASENFLFVSSLDLKTLSLWTPNDLESDVYTFDTPLDEGVYKFLAVGREATDEWTITDPALNADITAFEASIAAVGTETDIYSGVVEHTVTESGGHVEIPIKRALAGMLLYIQNVPVQIEGEAVETLKFTIANPNLTLNLETGAGSDAAGTPYDIADIDLTSQGTSDGYYTGNTIPGVVKLPNSQLAGALLIPATATFTLSLYGGDAGDDLLKQWTLKDGSTSPIAMTPGYLYQFGTKKLADSTDGGTDDDDTDDDKASDLSIEQSLSVTIVSEWGEVRDLSLVEVTLP